MRQLNGLNVISILNVLPYPILPFLPPSLFFSCMHNGDKYLGESSGWGISISTVLKSECFHRPLMLSLSLSLFKRKLWRAWRQWLVGRRADSRVLNSKRFTAAELPWNHLLAFITKNLKQTLLFVLIHCFCTTQRHPEMVFLLLFYLTKTDRPRFTLSRTITFSHL